jgi:hypothetical protein
MKKLSTIIQFIAKVKGKREVDGQRYGGRRERGSRDG